MVTGSFLNRINLERMVGNIMQNGAAMFGGVGLPALGASIIAYTGRPGFTSHIFADLHGHQSGRQDHERGDHDQALQRVPHGIPLLTLKPDAQSKRLRSRFIEKTGC